MSVYDAGGDPSARSGTGRPHSLRRIILLAVLVGVVILAAFIVWASWPTSGTPATTSATTPVSTDITLPVPAPATITAGSLMEAAGLSGDTIIGSVADGLNRCASRVEGVATSELYGFGVVFPDTLEGAVAASATTIAASHSVAGIADGSAQSLDQALWQPWTTGSDDYFSSLRDKLQVDADGAPLDSEGRPISGGALALAAYPRYGLYRVDVSTNVLVSLEWIMPMVASPVPRDSKDNLTPTTVQLLAYHMTMGWTGDTWKAYGVSMIDPLMISETQSGLDWGSNWSFEQRASLVDGSGWCVSADATTDPIPGAWLTR